MKKVIWLLPALLVFAAACSKEETTAPATEEPAAAVEEAVEEATEAVEEETATEEEVVVVEESAGDSSEPADEAIILAQADAEETPRNWKFREGTHYTRLVPSQPTVGGPDKVEVAEVFMYSCPGCRAIEASLQNWEEGIDPNVRFVRIPAIFNQLAAVHAQLYYTEEVLARNGQLADRNAFRTMVFTEFHNRGNRLTTEEAAQRVFARAGVDEDTFNRTWNSFEVSQSLRRSSDLIRRYGVVSVPALVVNGKYKVNFSSASSYAEILEIVDELTAREGVR